MKNSTNGGFDQHYNIQAAVDQDSLFVVGNTLSNHLVGTYRERFAQTPEPPPDDMSLIAKMVYKLQIEIGKAIYGLRQSTVEPVIGIIKEVLGFRQFPLRGLGVAAGEWCLLCLAWNLKRLHKLATS